VRVFVGLVGLVEVGLVSCVSISMGIIVGSSRHGVGRYLGLIHSALNLLNWFMSLSCCQALKGTLRLREQFVYSI